MKIEKYFDRRAGVEKFRARFQLSGKEFYPKAATRRALLETIDEIRAAAHRKKFDLPVPEFIPALSDLFIRHAPKIEKRHQRKIFERVSRNLLDLLPAGIKITELKRAHFSKYIDLRRSQTGVHTGQKILDETIDKELYSISSALRDAPLYFTQLDDYKKPEIPKAHKGKKRRRTRLVSKTNELEILLAELRKPRIGKQTDFTVAHRRRLADELEFKFETGLRRKEVARIKPEQYYASENALRDVVRWKTNTVTKFFPLSLRACAIIEERIKNHPGGFIFSAAGDPVESDYRTLRETCKKLKIPYGRYADNGFVPHDLRHNFASEIISGGTDIETARELLGHSSITQTGAYLHTNEKQLSAAIRRRDGTGAAAGLVKIYKAVRRRKMTAKKFVEILRNFEKF